MRFKSLCFGLALCAQSQLLMAQPLPDFLLKLFGVKMGTDCPKDVLKTDVALPRQPGTGTPSQPCKPDAPTQ